MHARARLPRRHERPADPEALRAFEGLLVGLTVSVLGFWLPLGWRLWRLWR